MATLTLSSHGQSDHPATSPEIQYMGRTHASEGSVTLAFPGQQIRLRFAGGTLAISGELLHGQCFFNAELDGIPLPRIDIPTGPFNITLAENLEPEDTHALQLVRRNEAWQGVIRIDEIHLDSDGKLLAPDPLPSRKILCIGDSITCGEAVDLIPPATPGIHNANAGKSYGWLLAQDFDAQVHLVSYGGKGLIRDWQGLSTEVTAPQFFERELPDDPNTVWNHDNYQPDLVTIALGTNDFSQGIPDQVVWIDAYVSFIKRIHEVHPHAKILLLSGPIFGEHDVKRTVIEHYLSEIETRIQDLGTIDLRTHFLAAYPGGKLDAHPDAPQHRQMAVEIAGTLRDWLGW